MAAKKTEEVPAKAKRHRRSAEEMAAARAAGLAPPKQIRTRSPGRQQPAETPASSPARRPRKAASDAPPVEAENRELMGTSYILQLFHHFEDIKLSVWIDWNNTGTKYTREEWLAMAKEELENNPAVRGYRLVRVLDEEFDAGVHD